MIWLDYLEWVYSRVFLIICMNVNNYVMVSHICKLTCDMTFRAGFSYFPLKIIVNTSEAVHPVSACQGRALGRIVKPFRGWSLCGIYKNLTSSFGDKVVKLADLPRWCHFLDQISFFTGSQKNALFSADVSRKSSTFGETRFIHFLAQS